MIFTTSKPQTNWCLTRAMLLMAVGLLFFCTGSVAAPPATLANAKKLWFNQWAWTTQPWTGNSRPFQQARAKIDTLIASGKNPTALLPQYEANVRQNPNLPLPLFSWAYVSYQIAKLPQTTLSSGDSMLSKPLQAFADAKSPHAYEYDRLRFLMISYSPFFNGEIKPVALRLLQQDPNDTKVKLQLAYILCQSGSLADQQQALILAQEVAKVDKTSLALYSIPAGIYMSRWLRHHNKSDAAKAKSAYQQWLQHAPANDSFRESAKTHIRTLDGN